jgi:tetratricopeptide (TPR) repeat protein
MAADDRANYEKAAKLAEAGQHEEALACIKEYLRSAPDDVEALNDTGAILHCLGRADEAIEYLLRAGQIDPDNAQVVWNLIEVYLAAGRCEDAMGLFEQAERMRVLNPEVINRAANQLIDRGNKAAAMEVLLRSLRLWPNQDILHDMLTVIKSKRPKIAFICGADGMTFLQPIHDFIAQRFEVRVFEGRTEQQLAELMQWSDINWFEWCTDLAVAGSNLPKVCRNIIRLHRYEAYGQWPQQVNWNNIDLLVTVGNSFVKEALFNSAPAIQSQTSMVTIANGVDLDRIRFADRPRGKNIAYVGYLNARKNPMLLLQCMQKLHYMDPEYKLFRTKACNP